MNQSNDQAEPARAVIAPGVTQVHRASPPRAPLPSAKLVSAREEHAVYVEQREHTERSGIMRALLVLGFIVLVGSIWRTGLDRVFAHGWWKQW